MVARDLTDLDLVTATLRVFSRWATWASESKEMGIEPVSRNGSALRDEAHRRLFPKTKRAPRGKGSKV